MAELGSSTVYGDLKVTGKIIGDGAGGAGGITIGAADFGGTRSDTGAGTGMTKQVTTSTSAEISVATIDIENLKYGLYSVMLRVFMTNGTSGANLIKMQTYHVVNSTETLLNTAYIKPTDGAGYWGMFGFVTDFKGVNSPDSPILRIKISTVANPVSQDTYYDYVMVSPTYTSIYSLPTT